MHRYDILINLYSLSFNIFRLYCSECVQFYRYDYFGKILKFNLNEKNVYRIVIIRKKTAIFVT